MKYIITTFLVAMLSFSAAPNKISIAPEISDAYAATCRLRSADSIGTGVFLDTGFILTAAHLVDVNQDGVLNYDELSLWAETFGDAASVQTADVIFMGHYLSDEREDFAILSVPNPVVSSIHLAENAFCDAQPFGQRIFTIGASQGGSLRVTDGRLDQFVNDVTERATCDILPGNSGGGIFIESNHNLLGIVVQGYSSYEYTPLSLAVPIPTPDGVQMETISGQIILSQRASSWAYVINSKDMRETIHSHGLDFAINPIKIPQVYTIAFAVAANLLLLIVLVRSGINFARLILGR
jgi:hypothetical protein